MLRHMALSLYKDGEAIYHFFDFSLMSESRTNEPTAVQSEAKNPFFSVVIPVYNSEKYLDECIQSILNQSFQDFEVIVMDDCSTDSSGEICDKYAASDSRFRVFHNVKNLKILINRTSGIKKARGQFVVCIDNDDKLRSDTFEKIHDAITEFNADTVFYSCTHAEDFSSNEGALKLKANQVIDKFDVLALFCTYSSINPTWRKAFRSGIINDIDFTKYSHVFMCEDQVISCFIYDSMERPYYIDEPLYFFRPTPTSVTHTFRSNEWETQKSGGQCLVEAAKRWDAEMGIDHALETIVLGKIIESFYKTAVHFLLSAPNFKIAKGAIKEMSNDSFFLEYYAKRKSAKLTLRKKTVLFAVRHRWYLLLRILRSGWNKTPRKS